MNESIESAVPAGTPAGRTPATRQAGLAQLAAFMDQGLDQYSQARHEDPGPGVPTGVSLLSRWIRPRLLLDGEVAAAALTKSASAGRAAFLDQLCWRTYWKAFLEYHPSVWTQFLARAGQPPTGEPGRQFDRAREGRTGIDAFDGWLAELQATGHLHNQARLGFASIWIHTLRLPWEAGAALFLQHLLDGDPASNTLSWRWVAGLHTAGKAYVTSAQIIHHCSVGRYAPAGLATEPYLSGTTAVDSQLPASTHALPQEPFALLLTPEDVHPESLPLPATGPTGVATLSPGSPLPEAPAVAQFRRDALADGVSRVQARFGHQAVAIEDGGDLVDYARTLGVRYLVVAQPYTGPVRAALDAVTGDLAAAGVLLVPVRREWDAVALRDRPTGFFRFRKRLPERVATIGDTRA